MCADAQLGLGKDSETDAYDVVELLESILGVDVAGCLSTFSLPRPTSFWRSCSSAGNQRHLLIQRVASKSILKSKLPEGAMPSD